MTIKQLKWASLYYGLLTIAWMALLTAMTFLGLFLETSVNVFECLSGYHRKGSLNIIDNGVGTFILGACFFAGAGYACLYAQDWIAQRLESMVIGQRKPSERETVPEQPAAARASKPTIPIPFRFKINRQILFLLLSLILGAILRGEYPSLVPHCP